MATTRQALNSRFQRGSAVYTCRICKHQTRDTGGDGVGVGSCDLCYDLAGEENHISDNGGKTYGKPENIAAQLKALDHRSGAGTARRLFPTVCDAAGYEVAPKVALILNQSQARAVYAAMCELNNFGARIAAEWDQVYDTGYYPKRKEQFEVREQRDGSILVRILGVDGKTYANQAAFATAYGLD